MTSQELPHQRPMRRVREIRQLIRGGRSPQSLADKLAGARNRQDAIAALAYSVWEIEGDLVASRNGDRSSRRSQQALQRELQAAERTLSILEKIDQNEQARRLAGVPRARSAPNHLSALVMQHLGGLPFQQDLRRLLAEDGLPPDAIHPRADADYNWARSLGLLPAPQPQVARFLQYSDSDFIEAMRKDAASPGSLPDHPLIAERRLLLDEAAMRRARHYNGTAEQQLSKIAARRRTSAHFARLRHAYHLAGMLALRQRQARVELAKSRLMIKKLTRSHEFMRLRADYLQRAAELAAQRNPSLWQKVLSTVVAHQQQCPEVRSGFPCAECAPELAQAIEADLRERVPPSPPSPPPERSSAEPENRKDAGLRQPEPERGERHPATARPQLRDKALTVAVGASANNRSTTVGLAWVSEDGQIGVATDNAGDLVEARTLAVCRAVADLDNSNLPLDIIVADQRALDRARKLLRQSKREAPAVAASLPNVAALLKYLIGRQGHVEVFPATSATDRSDLVRAASELSKVALAFVRGGRTQHDLRRKIEETAARLNMHETRHFTPPGQEHEGLQVRQSGRQLTWKQSLRAVHLANAVFPLPKEVRRAVSAADCTTRFSLTLFHRSPTCRDDKAAMTLRFTDKGDCLRLVGSRWPTDFFPGIHIDCTWQADKRSFVVKTMRLGTPLRIGGRAVGYSYDPKVFTRDTAPGGPRGERPKHMSVEKWVLRTMQILGYLDADGRAVLAEDALERNMVELGFPATQLPKARVAVKQLIKDGRLERVMGSVGPDGHPTYPPVRYRPLVALLSFQPEIIEETRPRRRQAGPGPLKRPHYVSGFVRRLPPGQTASREAIDAHAEAQRKAQIANDGPLKPGYTFVRKHRRYFHGH